MMDRLIRVLIVLCVWSIAFGPSESDEIFAFKIRDENKDPAFIRLLDEPENEFTDISMCLRIYPTKFDDDPQFEDHAISLGSVRLANMDAEKEKFDPDTHRFMEARFVQTGPAMIHGDRMYQFKSVFYNFKNNAYMGDYFEKFAYRWYHVCFSFFTDSDRKFSEQIVYLNGRMIFHGKKLIVRTKYPWVKGNKLQIGHSISKMTVTGAQLFGYVTDVQVFSERIESEDMMGYTTCKKKLTGNLGTWSKIDRWETVGGIDNETLSFEKICEEGHADTHVMIFPVLQEYQAAEEMCKRFRGWLHFDPDPDTLLSRDNVMFEQVKKVSYGNIDNERCGKRIFVGITDEDEEGVWRIKRTNELLQDHHKYFSPGQPNGAKKQNYGGWHLKTSVPSLGIAQFDDGADFEKSCFMCYFPLQPIARMRGLCDTQRTLDRFYTLVWDAENSIPYYKGYRFTKIVLNENLLVKKGRKQWEIIDIMNNSKILGTTEMIPKGSSLATGLKTWSLTEEVCGSTELELELSACDDSQFTCKEDGKCIDMSRRCDKYPNCKDFSDEVNCYTVVTDEKYNADFPPITVNKEDTYQRLEVAIAIELSAILNIDEVEQIFETRFRLLLTWSDFRLKYNHLKNNSDTNVLTVMEKDMVWNPRVTFVNTKAMDVSKNDDKSFMLIRKETPPSYNPLSEMENLDIFSGATNPVVLARTYNVEWICDYDMHFYPFDTQICLMEFRSYGNGRINIKVIANYLSYDGPKDLTQYFIRRTNLSLSVTSDEEKVVVEVTLGRRLLGTILTVYIPTVLMICISQATNYFKPFFFEAIVTVNLTVMLVLTTMFLSVSKGLPATSYVKMVDIWLIFNLCIPFILVLMHTYIDYLRNAGDQQAKQAGENDGIADSDEKNQENGGNNVLKVKEAQPAWTVGEADEDKNNGLGLYGTLVSVREQDQQKALRNLYAKLAENTYNLKFQLCILFIHYGVPLLALIFSGLYFYIGLLNYFEMY